MIKLKYGWAINADASQYILGKPTTVIVKDKPIQQMQNATYHGTLDNALTAYLRRIQRDIVHSHDLTLEEACKAFVKAHNEVVAKLGDIENIKKNSTTK